MQQASSVRKSTPDTEKKSDQQASVVVSTGPGHRGRLLRGALWVALWGAVLASLILPLASTGLWDPFELETAELARRVAVTVFGAENLASGVNDSIPTVEEVGHGELPLLSFALSLKLFGISRWALRAPLALWALLSLGSLYAVSSRLGSRRLAVTAVLALATCPLFFVHARTALGDIATMACLSVSFCGAMLATFDRRARGAGRAAWLLAGLLGMVGGAYCRGVLIGVALPALSVALVAWMLPRGEAPFCADVDAMPDSSELTSEVRALPPKGERYLELLWVVLLTAIGLAAAAWGAWAALHATSGDYFKALGSAVVSDKQLPTHDYVVRYLGHGMLPWSALVPLGLGLALRPAKGRGARAATALRLGFVLLSALGVAAYGALAPRVGLLPFAPIAGLAGVCAVALTELDDDRSGQTVMAMLTAALLVLFYIDFKNFPDKAFSAFAVDVSKFPPGFESNAKRYILAVVGCGIVACAGVVVLRALELFRPIRKLRRTVLGRRWAARIDGKLKDWDDGLRLLYMRGTVMASGLVFGGMVLSFGYYPALGAQVSPAGAFDTYRELARPGEPLAMLGASEGSLFLAGSPAEVFKSSNEALTWLTASGDERRWLVSKLKELATLNARYRRLASGQGNLPVLSGRSEQALLVSNLLREGERSENPFDAMVLSAPPQLAHPLEAELDQRLKVLGWEVRKRRNAQQTDRLEAGEPYEFVIAYEVLSRLSGSWQTFVHIDGSGKRINGDHDTLQDKYPYRNWNPGDFIVDVHAFDVEGGYTPGEYEVYFGMFKGEKRMPVTRGKHDEDRIVAGKLTIVEQ